MSEGQIQDEIRLALSDEPGLVLWRIRVVRRRPLPDEPAEPNGPLLEAA